MENKVKIPLRKNFLLAIGIDKYANSRFNLLHNATHDVRKITKILLEKYDFELVEDPILNENATRKKIIDSLSQLVAILTKEDNLIIYFAGHGEKNTLTSHGYWIPFDGNDSQSSYIPNSTVKDAIEGIEAKHIFLISDSCYSGTFLTRTRAGEDIMFYEKLDVLKSRWILASGGEEKVSDGFEPDKGSPFCNELYNILNRNVNKHLSVTEIINYVSHSTRQIAKQQPVGAFMQNVGHEDGQMVLILSDKFAKNENSSFKIDKKEERKVDGLKLSAGKEVLIIKSFAPNADHMVLELFRFDDDGEKRHVFKDNIVRPIKTKDDEKVEWELIQRFATNTGALRYVDEHLDLFKDSKVIIWPAKDIDDVEDSDAAKKHFKKLQQLKISNTTLMNCLHCSKKIDTNDSLFVEIDELDLKEAVGNVHKNCLRPADRILGKSTYPDLEGTSALINFDYDEWINLRKRGQGFLNGVSGLDFKDKIPVIAWNPNHRNNSGMYCIRLITEDGSSSYVHLGKDIQRFKETEIDDELHFFKTMLKNREDAGDPAGFTSRKRTFGFFSNLPAIKEADEKILKVVGVEKAKFSNQLTQIKSEIDNDYAPLGLVIDHITEDIINLRNCVPLISDPSNFDKFHTNWNSAGYGLDKCELRIIRSDSEFDDYMQAFLDDGMLPILDPLFDQNAHLVQGCRIANVNDMKRKQSHSNSQPLAIKKTSFVKNQTVEVVFPGVNMPTKLIGILLTDEFEDEEGEIYAIINPIEKGKVTDFTLKMPVKLFKLVE